MNLLEYLKENPEARERKNKNKVISKMVWDRYTYCTEVAGTNTISKKHISDMVGEILNLDRKWRLILKENPELRGTDYGDKEMLEVEKQRELGYNV